MEKKCPHCGALLPEEASFCPHCAKTINRRSEAKPPRRIPAKIRRTVLCLVLLAVCGICLWLYTRPKTYDNLGVVDYTDADGSYQIIMNVDNNRYRIMTEIRQDYGMRTATASRCGSISITKIPARMPPASLCKR